MYNLAMYVVNNEDVLIRIVSCEVEVKKKKISALYHFVNVGTTLNFVGESVVRPFAGTPLYFFYVSWEVTLNFPEL